MKEVIRSRELRADGIPGQKLTVDLSFHIFVSGSAVRRCLRGINSQLDALRSLATGPNPWIEEGTERGETGANDRYIHFYNRPDAGLDIGPWCSVSLIAWAVWDIEMVARTAHVRQ